MISNFCVFARITRTEAKMFRKTAKLALLSGYSITTVCSTLYLAGNGVDPFLSFGFSATLAPLLMTEKAFDLALAYCRRIGSTK